MEEWRHCSPPGCTSLCGDRVVCSVVDDTEAKQFSSNLVYHKVRFNSFLHSPSASQTSGISGNVGAVVAVAEIRVAGHWGRAPSLWGGGVWRGGAPRVLVS